MLLCIVKDRLQNESKTKRHAMDHPIIKKLMDLTEKAKQVHPRSSKNPEESRRGSSIKDLHRSMEV